MTVYVSDMSATCRRHVEKSPIFEQHACRGRHTLAPTQDFLCQGLPTLYGTHKDLPPTTHTHNPNPAAPLCSAALLPLPHPSCNCCCFVAVAGWAWQRQESSGAATTEYQQPAAAVLDCCCCLDAVTLALALALATTINLTPALAVPLVVASILPLGQYTCIGRAAKC